MAFINEDASLDEIYERSKSKKYKKEAKKL